MAMTILEFQFPYAGPWGPEMTSAYSNLAKQLGETPGMVWKIWMENRQAGQAGGIYLFADEASAEQFFREHQLRLKNMGMTDVVAKKFTVNEGLTQMTGGPLTRA